MAKAQLDDERWRELVSAAWRVRGHARVHGKTKVGVAVLSEQGHIYIGCNVEHIFRSHDVHAEVNALTSMASGGDGPAVALLIAAARDRFTPCGACLDWIFELGGAGCLVGFQPAPDAAVEALRADALMPHYPY